MFRQFLQFDSQVRLAPRLLHGGLTCNTEDVQSILEIDSRAHTNSIPKPERNRCNMSHVLAAMGHHSLQQLL